MAKFPRDAPKQRVVKTLESLGFRLVREHEHIAMVRDNADGSQTPLTMPNHRRIKGSTLRAICTQANISRNDFLHAYSEA
jgi:predicted RNA binding protein YcfA (HicA-like mRNA interferase family)